MLDLGFLNKRISTYKLLLEQIFALSFIGIFSHILFFQHVSKLALSLDGLFYTILQYKNKLPSFSLVSAKDPGRPFLYLPWNLALLTGGGSVDGYNLFTFICVTLNSVLFFWLFLLVLGRKFILIALLAAVMKLVWSANHDIFDNASLAIYFCEMLFWIACLIFTLLKLRRIQGIQLVFAYIVMVVALLIPLGIYQPLWLPTLLFPLLLHWQKPMGIKSQKNLTLFVWYVPAVTAISIFFVVVRRNLPDGLVTPDVGSSKVLTVIKRFSEALGPATVEGLLIPVAKFQLNISVTPVWFSALLIAFLLVACFYLGRRLFNSKLNESFNPNIKRHYDLMWIAVLLVTIGLLPFCVITAPAYGTRYVHWASFGTILFVFAMVAFLLNQPRKISWLFAALLVCAVIFTQALENRLVGLNIALNHYPIRQFWRGLTNTFPSVAEETFVVFDNSPRSVAMSDYVCTLMLRNFTATQETFCFVDDKPAYPSEAQPYVTLKTRLELDNADMEEGAVLTSHRFSYTQPTLVKLPKEKVIWATWDQTAYQVKLLPNQKTVSRISDVRQSTYGTRLFPN